MNCNQHAAKRIFILISIEHRGVQTFSLFFGFILTVSCIICSHHYRLSDFLKIRITTYIIDFCVLKKTVGFYIDNTKPSHVICNANFQA